MSYSSIKVDTQSMNALSIASPNNSPLTQSPSMATTKFQAVLAKKSTPESNIATTLSSSSASVSASTSSSLSTLSSPELLRCKRRINFGGLGYALPQTQPATVARRNERERNRVKMVNMGFATLRQHVPNGAKNKKMSKVETLRSAVEYIRQLQQLLGGDTDQINCTNGQCSDNLQSVSSDENWNPSPSTMSSSGTLQSPSNHSLAYTCGNSASINSSMVMRRSNSPSSPLITSSPTPSMGSDASSPYDSMDSMERQVSPEEEELFDFTTWFS